MAGGKRKPREDDQLAHHFRLAPVSAVKQLAQGFFASPPPLDNERALLCLQHVRALNSQFSSWVRTQEQEHLDELWQGGVQEYLKHAASVLEDFKDVVESLKANANTAMPTVPPSTYNSGPNHHQTSISTFGVSSSRPSPGPPAVFSTFGSDPTMLSFPDSAPLPRLSFPPRHLSGVPEGGAQVQNGDEGDSVEEPSSPSLKRTAEEGVLLVHEVRSKLFIKADKGADKAWKDMGAGHFTLKRNKDAKEGSKGAKATVMFRNDVGKVLLNAMLYPNIKVNVAKTSVTAIYHSVDDLNEGFRDANATTTPQARVYALKVKSEAEATALAESIRDNAPTQYDI